MTNAPLPTHKLAYCALYPLSLQLLDRDGCVALGDLFTSIRTGEGGYEGVPPELTAALSGLEPVEIQGVYELVLLRLEKERGPLACHDADDQGTGVTWGYSAPFGTPSPACVVSVETMLHRLDTLNDGHPDACRDFDAGTLPRTVWYRAVNELAA